MDCPKCGVGKLSEVVVPIGRYSTDDKEIEAGLELKVDQCFTCSGIWFDASELEKYLSEDINLLDSPEVDPALKKTLDKKPAQCPRCRVALVKQCAPHNRQVTIDVCKQCKGAWLDSGEIDDVESKNIWTKRKLDATKETIIDRIKRIFGKPEEE